MKNYLIFAIQIATTVFLKQKVKIKSMNFYYRKNIENCIKITGIDLP
jgi:hypothetical protein